MIVICGGGYKKEIHLWYLTWLASKKSLFSRNKTLERKWVSLPSPSQYKSHKRWGGRCFGSQWRFKLVVEVRSGWRDAVYCLRYLLKKVMGNCVGSLIPAQIINLRTCLRSYTVSWLYVGDF
jgi:hypothetical protein